MVDGALFYQCKLISVLKYTYCDFIDY